MIPTSRLPTHPGEVLREEFIRPLEIQQILLADRLGISLQRLNEIVNERRGVTADTAWRLAQAFRTTPQFWMNLQTNYDLAVAKEKVPAKTVRPLAESQERRRGA